MPPSHWLEQGETHNNDVCIPHRNTWNLPTATAMMLGLRLCCVRRWTVHLFVIPLYAAIWLSTSACLCSQAGLRRVGCKNPRCLLLAKPRWRCGRATGWEESALTGMPWRRLGCISGCSHSAASGAIRRARCITWSRRARTVCTSARHGPQGIIDSRRIWSASYWIATSLECSGVLAATRLF